MSADAVWQALDEVLDPELPALSVVDLGIIRAVTREGDTLRVEVMPTFVGCPALHVITDEIARRLAGFAPKVEVAVTFAESWTSDRITPRGRERLRAHGFAPPTPVQPKSGAPTIALIPVETVACPYCGSDDTVMENPFGPTLCRAIHYCRACRQPFERFKAL